MHTFLIAAVSQDGYIAEKVDQSSTDWTSREDANFFRQRTKEAGVMVMGRRTFETIGRPLPGREMIVVSSQLSVDGDALDAGLQVRPLDELLEMKAQMNKSRVFEASHASQEKNKNESTIWVTQLPPYELVKKVEQLGFLELAVCGGASIYRQYLKAGLLETLYLTLEPVRFGSGVELFAEGLELGDLTKIPQQLELSGLRYELKKQRALNEQGTILLEYLKK